MHPNDLKNGKGNENWIKNEQFNGMNESKIQSESSCGFDKVLGYLAVGS